MKCKKNEHHRALLACALLTGCIMPGYSRAALQDMGDGTLYDTTLKIYWLKDANLFNTQYQADNSILQAIVDAAPDLDDPNVGGPHQWTKDATLTDVYADFVNQNATNAGAGVDGGMTWYGAMAWVNWLNVTKYLGHDDWRLPTVKPNGASFNYTLSCDGSTDLGYYNTSPNNELSHLFYVDLPGNVGDLQSDCVTSNTDFGLLNKGPFENFKNNTYWTGLDYLDPPGQQGVAWVFYNQQGTSGQADKAFTAGYALAVRSLAPGEAPPSPAPSVSPAPSASPSPVTSPTPSAAPSASPEPSPSPSASPSPTPVPIIGAGYGFSAAASCQRVGKSGRRAQFAVLIGNSGSQSKPGGVLQVQLVQDGQSRTLKARKIKLKAGKAKLQKFVTRVKADSSLQFTARLSDGVNTVESSCQVQ